MSNLPILQKSSIMDYFTSAKPKMTEYSLEVDILAASIAWKRIKEGEASAGFESMLLDPALHQQINSDDIEHAERIRSYYGQKMTFAALTKTEMSPFRKSLASFLQTDGKKFATENLGMLYWLPYFYDYDQKFETMKPMFQGATQLPKVSKKHAITLAPIQMLNTKPTKPGSMNEYWFKEKESGSAVIVKVQRTNPLLKLWDANFKTSPTIAVTGTKCTNSRDGLTFYIIDDWQLALDNNS
jgi:hypothetical protein